MNRGTNRGSHRGGTNFVRGGIYNPNQQFGAGGVQQQRNPINSEPVSSVLPIQSEPLQQQQQQPLVQQQHQQLLQQQKLIQSLQQPQLKQQLQQQQQPQQQQLDENDVPPAPAWGKTENVENPKDVRTVQNVEQTPPLPGVTTTTATAAATPTTTIEREMNDELTTKQESSIGSPESELSRLKRIFQRRKKSSVRLKERKLRQNRQLRRIITPKNALMALNEVKGIVISDFIINNNLGGGFTAVVTVNNNQFEGKGNSKMNAKNDACEKALRDYVLNKMVEKPRIHHRKGGNSTATSATESMDTTEENSVNNNNNSSNNNDNGNDGVAEQMKTGSNSSDESDDVPMVNLASFALYKLFTEWENQGYPIPEMHPNIFAVKETPTEKEPENKQKTKKATIRNELPQDWQSLHPASVLSTMRPGATFNKDLPMGVKPNILQVVNIEVDEQKFIGTGLSLKIARRNAAIKACNELFGTNYVEE